jgi:hypothetical protein
MWAIFMNEEEVPLFGKAQLESGQVDLLLVGFYGSEIGIEGEVPRNRLGERVAGWSASCESDSPSSASLGGFSGRPLYRKPRGCPRP